MGLKVLVPTDDGRHIRPDFEGARRFASTEVFEGDIGVVSVFDGSGRYCPPKAHVEDIARDFDVVIVNGIGVELAMRLRGLGCRVVIVRSQWVGEGIEEAFGESMLERLERGQ